MSEIIKGVTACEISECESMQSDLNYIASTDSWLCSEHLNDVQSDFESMAMSAMSDLGLPDDEAEAMLDGYSLA